MNHLRGATDLKGPVLIVGGRGYVGSALSAFLIDRGWEVASLDLNWFPAPSTSPTAESRCFNVAADYGSVPDDFFAPFSEVILLAGHSSVGMCNADPCGAIQNNLVNFVRLSSMLEPHQRLTFASSASVYGRSGGALRDESSALSPPENVYDATKQHLEQYASLSKVPRVALRFGTVCGGSPNMRTDTVLNAMCRNVAEHGIVRLANPESWRPVLGMRDLCRAIEGILEAPGLTGIYNLCSFNAPFSELAAAVADRFPEASIERFQAFSAYDMAMSCDKFTQQFAFAFEDTASSIIDELARQQNKEGSSRSEEQTRSLLK